MILDSIGCGREQCTSGGEEWGIHHNRKTHTQESLFNPTAHDALTQLCLRIHKLTLARMVSMASDSDLVS